MEVYTPKNVNTYIPVESYEDVITNILGDHIQNYAWMTQPLGPFM